MENDPLHNQPVLAPLALLTEQLLRTTKSGIYRQVALEVDRVVLNTVLRHVQGNQSRASELLGISRTTLRAKLRAVRRASVIDPQFRTTSFQLWGPLVDDKIANT